MATLTVQRIVLGGLNPSLAAADVGGDDFANDGSKTFLVVENGGGGAITVTLDDTGSVSPSGAKAFDADVDVSVPAGETRWIGPLPQNRFGSTAAVTYSGVTSVSVGAVVI